METLLKEPKYSIIPYAWKIWYFILSQFNAKEYYDDFYENIDWDNLDDEERRIRDGICVRLCDIVWKEYHDDDYHECRYLDELIPRLYNLTVCKSLDITKVFDISKFDKRDRFIIDLVSFANRVINIYEYNYESYAILSDSSRRILDTIYNEFRLVREIYKCVHEEGGFRVKWRFFDNVFPHTLRRHPKILSSLKDLGKGIAFDLDIEYVNFYDVPGMDTIKDIKIDIHTGHGLSAYVLMLMLSICYCKTNEDILSLSKRVHWDESYESLMHYDYSVTYQSIPEFGSIYKDHHYESYEFNDNELEYFRLFVQRGVFDDATRCFRYTDYEKFIFKVYLAQVTKDRSYKLNLLNRCLIEENRYLLSNFFHLYSKYISTPFIFYTEVVRSSSETIHEISPKLLNYGWLSDFMSELDTFIWNKADCNVNPNCILADIHSYLTEYSEKDIYNYAQYLYYNNLRIHKDIYEKLQARIEDITNQNNIYINYISDIIKNEKLYTRDSDELEIQNTDFLEDEKESLDSEVYASNRYNATPSFRTLYEYKEDEIRILEELRRSDLISYEENNRIYVIKCKYPQLCEYLINNKYLHIGKGRLSNRNIQERIDLINNRLIKREDITEILKTINWGIINSLNLHKTKDKSAKVTLSDTKSHFTDWAKRYILLNQLLENYMEMNEEEDSDDW